MLNPKAIFISVIQDKVGWIIPSNLPALEFVRSIPDITKEVNTKAEFIAADIVVKNWINNFMKNPCGSGRLSNLGFAYEYLNTDGTKSTICHNEMVDTMKGMELVVSQYNNKIENSLKKF